MAQRPGFSRVDTDQQGIPLRNFGDIKGESSKDQHWRNDDAESLKGAKAGVIEVGDGAPPAFDAEAEDHFGEGTVVTSVSILQEATSEASTDIFQAADVVTHVLHVDDDPTLSPWTFRAFFIGMHTNT